ncbi:hypothetical protein ACHAXR_009070 [Thalassiosira sp. AJA248-18]
MSGCTSILWEGNPAWLQPTFCASLYTSGLVKPRGLHIDTSNGGLVKPRGLHIDTSNDEILLVERGNSRVVRLDADGTNIVPVAEGITDLNHGIELAGGYLYASTPTTVYRWPYQTGQTTAGNTGDVQQVIVGMDRTASDELGAWQGHTTRTLAFDADARWLYVSIGSRGNVDANSFRSRIRRFDIAAWDKVQPLKFIDGEVFADGLRNEVGLAFDTHGDLWGVENGADNLQRTDLGGDIHHDNPSEELNRFREDQAGEHWGYPYCWAEYCLPVENGGSGMKGANTVWAWPSFISSGYTDEWCRDNTNPPAMSMPAHSAPLGITFYNWRDMSQEEYANAGCNGGFPKSMDGYAFIAFHGSWNRSPPTGYKVVFVPFDDQGDPTALPIDLLRHDGVGAKWPYAVRPVDVQFDSCGRLFVTEDGTGNVIKITYNGGYLDTFVSEETDVDDGASCSPFELPSMPPSVSPSKKPTAEPTNKSTSGHSSSPSKDPPAVETNSTDKPTTKSPSGSPSTSKSWTLKPDNSCCPEATVPNNGSCDRLNSLLSRSFIVRILICVCASLVTIMLWQ